jgi:hypothetical protein
MYGMTARRFEPDIYKKTKWLKQLDFMLGFLSALLAWVLFFKPVWWAVPLVAGLVCAAGIFLQIKRRYIFYGALSVVFFPFTLWAILMIVWAGRGEMKS